MKEKLIWIHKSISLKAAAEFERGYYSKMPAADRLETVQLLREQYQKMKKRTGHENRKGLRRSIKIIQQAQG